MRALIVDDERLARAGLRRLLEARGDVEVVGEADGVERAVQVLRATEPELLFLDVRMLDGSGFELFERTAVTARVVFVTAYDEFALRAFEVNALDYLLKPVGPRELARAMERLARPAARPGAVTVDDALCLKEGAGTRFFRVREILTIRAAGDYSELLLSTGRTLLSSESLRRWEARLPASAFARVHRATLVGLLHVVELDDEVLVLTLRATPPVSVPVSRRFARALRRRLSPSPGSCSPRSSE